MDALAKALINVETLQILQLFVVFSSYSATKKLKEHNDMLIKTLS